MRSCWEMGNYQFSGRTIGNESKLCLWLCVWKSVKIFGQNSLIPIRIVNNFFSIWLLGLLSELTNRKKKMLIYLAIEYDIWCARISVIRFWVILPVFHEIFYLGSKDEFTMKLCRLNLDRLCTLCPKWTKSYHLGLVKSGYHKAFGHNFLYSDKENQGWPKNWMRLCDRVGHKHKMWYIEHKELCESPNECRLDWTWCGSLRLDHILVSWPISDPFLHLLMSRPAHCPWNPLKSFLIYTFEFRFSKFFVSRSHRRADYEELQGN